MAATEAQSPVPEDSPTQSTLEHRAWVALGAAGVVAVYCKAAVAVAVNPTARAPAMVMGALVAYFLADVGTAVYHWAVDNYGSKDTPVVGSQIQGFQVHHEKPWKITQHELCNNIYCACQPVSLFLALHTFVGEPCAGTHSFWATFWLLVILSQQFHCWSHGRSADLPRIVCWLQDAGLLISRKMHGRHHHSPFECNYAIVSGLSNPLLDCSGFFRWMERRVFSLTGNKPRSWIDPSGWTPPVEPGTEPELICVESSAPVDTSPLKRRQTSDQMSYVPA